VNIKYRVIFIALSLMLTACVNYLKKDISSNLIFNDIINVELKLLRPMAIMKEKGLSYFDMVDIDSGTYKKASGSDKFYKDSFEILHVDINTPLFIQSIIREKMDQDFTIIVAAGKIYSKEKKDWVKFEYIWANTGVRRTAPWESKVDEQALKQIIDN